MAHRIVQGCKAYIIDNVRFIREVVVLRVTRDLCIIKYIDTGSTIRIRKSRLYTTEKEAKEAIPFSARPKTSHWDYYMNH